MGCKDCSNSVDGQRHIFGGNWYEETAVMGGSTWSQDYDYDG